MESRTILVVDDDPEIREVLRLLLTGEGYRVMEADSGDTALELLNNSVDLVILDVMMPGLNGYAACAEMRKNSAVPILFLTAKAQDSDKSMGFSVGGDDFPGKSHAAPLLRLRCKSCGAEQSDSLLRHH